MIKIAEHYVHWAQAAAVEADAAFALHHQVAPRERWQGDFWNAAMHDAPLLDVFIPLFVHARRARVCNRLPPPPPNYSLTRPLFSPKQLPSACSACSLM